MCDCCISPSNVFCFHFIFVLHKCSNNPPTPDPHKCDKHHPSVSLLHCHLHFHNIYLVLHVRLCISQHGSVSRPASHSRELWYGLCSASGKGHKMESMI